MRLFRTISAVGVLCVALVALVAPGAVLAAPCDGSHYEFDHGECYDKTGSTTSDMMKMYDDGDRLQQGIITRSQARLSTPGGLGASRGVGLPTSARDALRATGVAAYRILSFTPSTTSIAVDDLTRTVPRAERARARRVMSQLYRDYRSYVASIGLPPSVLTTGYYFGLACAYVVFDGDRFSVPDLATGTWWGIALSITRGASARTTISRSSVRRSSSSRTTRGRIATLRGSRAFESKLSICSYTFTTSIPARHRSTTSSASRIARFSRRRVTIRNST